MSYTVRKHTVGIVEELVRDLNSNVNHPEAAKDDDEIERDKTLHYILTKYWLSKES
jgi:hypothetical protein